MEVARRPDVLEGGDAPARTLPRVSTGAAVALLTGALTLLPTGLVQERQPPLPDLAVLTVGGASQVEPMTWSGLVQVTARDGSPFDLLMVTLDTGPWRLTHTVTSRRSESHTVTMVLTSSCDAVAHLRVPQAARVLGRRPGGPLVTLPVALDGAALVEQPRADCGLSP